MRLAFATAIHVQPDVLIVDEALAVGDAIFANRVPSKVGRAEERKVTILFVSHDLGLVKRFCHRAILMLKGESSAKARRSEVVNRYVALVHDKQAIRRKERSDGELSSWGSGKQHCRRFEFSTRRDTNGSVPAGEDIMIEVTPGSISRERSHDRHADPERLGIEVFGTNTQIEGIDLGDFAPAIWSRCDSVSVVF